MITARRAIVVLLVGIALAATALVLGPSPRTADGPTGGLPDGAESTEVAELLAGFSRTDVAPAVVVFDRRGEQLTEQDREAIRATAPAVGDLGVAPGGSAVFSQD